MVTDELLPILQQRGYDTTRIGLLGWSMGGYGALRLAGLRGSRPRQPWSRSSPALWSDADDASPSAASPTPTSTGSARSSTHQARARRHPRAGRLRHRRPVLRAVQELRAGLPDGARSPAPSSPAGTPPDVRVIEGRARAHAFQLAHADENLLGALVVGEVRNGARGHLHVPVHGSSGSADWPTIAARGPK